MLAKKLEKVIEKYKIYETDNIVYGVNIPKVKYIIPIPQFTHVQFEKEEQFFFLFNNEGISIFDVDGNTGVLISWEEITAFTVSHYILYNKIEIKTQKGTVAFQLNPFVLGNPWIKKNTLFLENNNYFYPKKNGVIK